METGAYKNFGTMSVTCKAVDDSDTFKSYVLEVGEAREKSAESVFSCCPKAAPTRSSPLSSTARIGRDTD